MTRAGGLYLPRSDAGLEQGVQVLVHEEVGQHPRRAWLVKDELPAHDTLLAFFGVRVPHEDVGFPAFTDEGVPQDLAHPLRHGFARIHHLRADPFELRGFHRHVARQQLKKMLDVVVYDVFHRLLGDLARFGKGGRRSRCRVWRTCDSRPDCQDRVQFDYPAGSRSVSTRAARTTYIRQAIARPARKRMAGPCDSGANTAADSAATVAARAEAPMASRL